MSSGGYKRRLVQLSYLIMERGREKIGKLAFETGYSYKHFRYYIVPQLLALTDCIEYDRKKDELVWVCDRLTPEERAVLEARPVEG